MFNHVGHLTLLPDTSDDQVEAILAGLVGLPGQIDGLVSAEAVRDAGLTEGNATLRFHMRFESEDAWRAYGKHPAHVAVVSTHIGPVLGSKAFVQYDDDAVRRGFATTQG
jgi:heme-degrading monooxygenase HmoA